MLLSLRQQPTDSLAQCNAPDDVWEALQRLIEKAQVLGDASRDDALLVARYRDRRHFLVKEPAA